MIIFDLSTFSRVLVSFFVRKLGRIMWYLQASGIMLRSIFKYSTTIHDQFKEIIVSNFNLH